MLLKIIPIVFIIIHFVYIKSSINIGDINKFRILNETFIMDETECSNFTDCFNCTIIPYCRWIWNNQSCIPYDDENYTIPLLNESFIKNDINAINIFIDFIRKVCFLPYTPYIDNNNAFIYNDISLKYCGSHFINTPLLNYSENFKIELNNISGIYGVPYILCEFILLTGPYYFETNIEINEKEKENFYLLYSEDSFYFNELINETKSFTISNTGIKSNTFIYYGFKSFNSSPFKITYKLTLSEGSSHTTGYILIALIIFIFIIIVLSIIYIRNNSLFFKNNKNNKNNIGEEEEKIKDKSDYSMESLVKKQKLFDINKDQIIKEDNINKDNTNIPDNLLNKNDIKCASFENVNIKNLYNINEINICCLDNQPIDKNDIFKAKCGHLYHNKCFDLLAQDKMKLSKIIEIRCVSCQQLIYP